MPGMPLSVLNLPTKPDLAKTRFPFQICHCLACEHTFNGKYNSNLNQIFHGGCTMYNSGSDWLEHLEDVANLILREKVTEGAKLVEIGSGNGEFAALLKGENYTAYEPSVDAEVCSTIVPTVQRYFDGQELVIVKPDVLIMRHVLEHFSDPRAFLEELSSAANSCEQYLTIYIEVPNISPALESGRLEDWVYEHPQHFTRRSLHNLLEVSGWKCCQIDSLYNDEVLLATAYVATRSDTVDVSILQKSFCALYTTGGDLEDRLVFWGGAGKGANFINLMVGPMREGVVVVDSDDRKWGKYVPGTNYPIQSPEVLRESPPGDIIVTTTWRTEDIVSEICRTNIPYTRILNLVAGKLKEYHG
jgi:hypothetical protein